MISSLKYYPILIASLVYIISFVYKLMNDQFTITSLFRDFVLFIIVLFVARILFGYIEQILKNYWKII